jgi:protein-tyrosine-phosphatase
MAAGLLGQRLARLGVRASIRSAGVAADGQAPPPDAVQSLRRHGVDLSDHRSRELVPEDLAGADLVVGLERGHVRHAVLLSDGEAWPRCFTLRELVRRGSGAGPRPAHQALADWLAEVHRGRERQDLLGASTTDDLADPIGGTAAEYAATATAIATLVDQLTDLLWGRARRRSAPRASRAERLT